LVIIKEKLRQTKFEKKENNNFLLILFRFCVYVFLMIPCWLSVLNVDVCMVRLARLGSWPNNGSNTRSYLYCGDTKWKKLHCMSAYSGWRLKRRLKCVTRPRGNDKTLQEHLFSAIRGRYLQHAVDKQYVRSIGKPRGIFWDGKIDVKEKQKFHIIYSLLIPNNLFSLIYDVIVNIWLWLKTQY
jgi:hypothetical protein